MPTPTPSPLTLASTLSLNDGRAIPLLGFGVFQLEDPAACERAVRDALDAGYRHIDTAKVYGNEASVGKAIAESGVPRESLFVTTKGTFKYSPENVRKACDESLRALGTDYIDLYLIHWPMLKLPLLPAWETYETLRAEGKVRSIGVSNFSVRRLEQDLLPHTATVPAVNQIELHVFCQQRELVPYCQGKGIVLEAYSPLARAERMDHPVLKRVAASLGKTPAQVMIRYLLEKGIVTIPKASSAARIRENADVFGFELGPQATADLDACNEDFFSLAWRPEGFY